MDNNLSEFIDISRYCGMRLDLIQSKGGNTSVKYNDSEMYIKASGVSLTEVNESEGYSVVNYRRIADYLIEISDETKVKPVEEILQEVLLRGGRPSIELFLHALTDRVTMHIHSIVSCLITVNSNCEQLVQELFPEALIVEYGTPGIELAKEYMNAIVNYGKDYCPSIIFLKNHGVIISGKDYDTVKKVNEQLCVQIEDKFGVDFSPYRRSTELWDVFRNIGEYSNCIVYKVDNKEIVDYYNSNQNMWKYQFCPDCIVFLGKTVLIVNEELSEKTIIKNVKKGEKPVVIGYMGNLYIVSSSVRKAREIEEVLFFSLCVFRSSISSQLTFLSEAEQNKLLGLESEKYRQQV